MSDTPEQKEGTAKPKRGNMVKWVLFIIVLAVCLVWMANWLTYRFSHALTNSAFVESDLVTVTPLVGGHVAAIMVKEGESVHKGQLLAVLDDRDIRAEMAVRQAQVTYAQEALARARITAERVRGEVAQGVVAARQDVAQADASVGSAGNALEISRTQAEETVRAARAAEAAARAEQDALEKDYARMETLYNRGSLEKRRFDLAVAQREGARAKVTAAGADLARAEAARRQVAISENQVRQAQAVRTKSEAALNLSMIKEKSVAEAENVVRELEAQLEQARRAVEAAELKLEHTRITSPLNGVVAKKFVNPGDFASPGFPLFSVYDRQNIYVTANLEETKLKGVRLGAPVDVEVDAFSGVEFRGKVVEIGEAAGAKFAIIPRDTSAGEFTKVVQRIPVKIAVQPVSGKRLLPGMSAYVGIRLAE